MSEYAGDRTPGVGERRARLLPGDSAGGDSVDFRSSDGISADRGFTFAHKNYLKIITETN